MFFYPELPSVAPAEYMPDHQVIRELVVMLRRAVSRKPRFEGDADSTSVALGAAAFF